MRGLVSVLCVLVSIGPAMAAGDVEYGQYLSSECVTCHLAKPSDAGIPSIHGMDQDGLIGIMKLYRSKELENVTMQTIAQRLTDEDIAALAAYFASLPLSE